MTQLPPKDQSPDPHTGAGGHSPVRSWDRPLAMVPGLTLR